jgi:hypothetical protein
MTTTTSDQTGALTSHDYVYNYVELITSDGTVVDIRGLIVELNLYEDLFSPIMTGDMVMGDALDLISSYGMHGNEWLMISIDKPSLNKPIVKTFRIYKIGDRSPGSNGLQNYRMHFCSEELFISTQNLISKSYKGLRIDQIVSDLLTNKLGVAGSKINQIDPTSGVFDIIVPRMNALEAIAWLTPRGYGAGKNLWLFFENRDGFNFVAYETLLQNPMYQVYTKNITIDTDNTKNINTMLVLKVIQDHDILKAVRTGAFSSSMASLDIVNRKFSILNFNAAQSLAGNAVLNQNTPSNQALNRFGQSVYNTGDNMMKFVISTDADPTSNPLNIKKWLPQTIARLGLLNSFKAVAVIPGDPLVKVGLIVGIVFPKGEIQDSTLVNDPYHTGRAIVSSVHHKFVNDIHTTVMELMSDSVSSPYPTPQTTSPTIQSVVKA